MIRSAWFWLLISCFLIVLLTIFAPVEKTLGVNARIVYLHGAWVWAGLAAFAAAAGIGLAGILSRRPVLHGWSRAFGRTGLLLWFTFLPMSLYVMQANWNGLFFAEPRWRIPFTFAVVSVLLQAGLSFLPVSWASIGNLVFSIALFLAMRGMDNILHPISPVMSSDSRNIQLFFSGLWILLVLAAWQITRIFHQLENLPSGQRNSLVKASR
jgi:hypothetical protein